jgi:hypothetical protein
MRKKTPPKRVKAPERRGFLKFLFVTWSVTWRATWGATWGALVTWGLNRRFLPAQAPVPTTVVASVATQWESVSVTPGTGALGYQGGQPVLKIG